MLTRETIPCWYELSWKGRDGQPGILLRIHDRVVKDKEQIPIDAPLALDFMKDFGFKKFSNTFDGDFGFEDSLKRIGIAADGFLEYEIPTPLVKEISTDPCGICRGKGYDEDLEEKCIFCENGKTTYYNYAKAFAVSASLNLLLEFLYLFDQETDVAVPQLMSLSTVTIANSHGGSLGGEYSCELADYLRFRPVGTIPEMVMAMKTVWERMEGSIPEFRDHDFWARTQGSNGWLNVTCPGDAAGLHPSDGHVAARGGYKFSCHNVDTPMQQLVLLASLGALHDLVRGAQ